MRWKCVTAALALIGAPMVADAADLAIAWLQGGAVTWRAPAGMSATEPVPIGSLWKLFVHAYATEQRLDVPPYRCGATRQPGEEYCCESGGSIDLDAALAKSCGLAFTPARLGITPDAWQAFWAPRAPASAAWVADLQRMAPETTQPVAGILHAIAAVPPAARQAAQRALLPVMVNGYGHDALPFLGGSLRVKTFTWSLPHSPDTRWGGAAGWRVDGMPVWFAGNGASRTVLREHGEAIAAALPPLVASPDEEPCVMVDFFTRYPVAGVDRLPDRTPADAGMLSGRYRVRFENGNALVFATAGDMQFDSLAGKPRLRGRFALTEYLARVIDREADANEVEAARALAIVARSWLIENTRFDGGCWHVEDSSRAQRVSANPATAAARQAVLFGHGLVLHGAPARYRLATDTPGTLSWRDAVVRSRSGGRFDEILAEAFPDAVLGAEGGERECRRLAEVEQWITRMAPRWHRALADEPGFEPLSRTPTVCALSHGNPYADAARQRMYVRGVRTPDERIAIAHEYLHLAFRFHPRGADETFVERLARRLEEGRP
jgi:uncharacterized protein YfaQ (DUF2300 family)